MGVRRLAGKVSGCHVCGVFFSPPLEVSLNKQQKKNKEKKILSCSDVGDQIVCESPPPSPQLRMSQLEEGTRMKHLRIPSRRRAASLPRVHVKGHGIAAKSVNTAGER